MKKKSLRQIPYGSSVSDINTPQPTKTVGVGEFVDAINPVKDTQAVMFGTNQKNHNAPIDVPNGFTTQIPYNTSINSTIISNPSTIPVTDLYKLQQNADVSSSLMYITTMIMARIGEYKNEDKRCEDIVNDSLKSMNKRKFMRSLLQALWAGFSVVHFEWGYLNRNTNIIGFKDLPPDSILLAVTPEGRLDEEFGVMHYYYNISSQWQQNGKAFSNVGNAPLSSFGAYMTPQRQVAYNPIFLSAIPEVERMIYTFNPTGMAGNFYGTSLVAGAVYSLVMDYNNQMAKIQIATSYKASPLVVFQTDTQTTVMDGGKVITMAQNVANTLRKGSQSGYMVFEGMNAMKFDTIDNTANLEEMIQVLDYYSKMIRTAMISHNLSNGGSFASSKANQDNADDIITNFAEDLAHEMVEQHAKKVLDASVGVGKVKDYGYYEIINDDIETQTLNTKIAESLTNGGFIDPTNLEQVNEVLRKTGYAPVKKVSSMAGLNMTGAGQTNMTKTKESIKQPYAKGRSEVADDKRNAK